MMKKIIAGVVATAGTVLLTGVSYVLANEPKGEGAPDYSGVTSIYYTLIGLILAYGFYDSFLKKS
ncbi:MAG: hypothetical protein RL042_2445 [Nitrospirota bacterium]|jgi:hypothetical protein